MIKFCKQKNIFLNIKYVIKQFGKRLKRGKMNKPNVVLILSDDHGQWAMGAYGNNDIITPNLDNLAENGIRYNNCFCASPVCSPARASLLTGKMPSQHGVHDWLNGGNLSKEEIENVVVDETMSDDLKEAKVRRLLNVSSHEVYNIEYIKDFETYPSVLSQNGYTCALSGKWHLGNVATSQCGFDVWKPVARGGTPYMYPEVIEDGQLVIKNEYVTDYITNNALDFLEQHDSQSPFYLSVHYTAPHDPWAEDQQKKIIWDMYKDHKFPEHDNNHIHPDSTPGSPTPKDSNGAKLLKRGYYSAITAMDESIGKIINKLDELSLSNNTIVIYCSDNGMNLGQHGVWGKGNGTYPLNFYEQSIKIPLIISNPLTKEVGVNNSLVSQCDIFKTILSMCNINNEYDSSYPGIDFKSESSIVIHDEYGPNRMIRNGRYKYIHRYPHGPNELYDLEIDPDEQTNLINDDNYMDIILSLKNEMELWFEKYSDPLYDGLRCDCIGLGQINTVKLGEAPLRPFQKP